MKKQAQFLTPGTDFPTLPTDNKCEPGPNYWSLAALGACIKASDSLGAQETATFQFPHELFFVD